MKKRILISAILLICVLTLVTACEKKPHIYEHEHLIVMREAKEATCAQNGNDQYYECKKCHKLFLDDKGKNPIEYESVSKEKLAHTPKAEWLYGGRNHFHRCEVCGEKVTESEEKHSFGEDALCDICGYKKPSTGLEYKAYMEEGGYIIEGKGLSLTGIGDCNDIDVVIPHIYEKLPVIEIGDYAFLRCDTIQSIDIPDSVTSIGEGAFGNCTRLRSIVIGNGLTKIDSFAFSDCTSLPSIDIPNSVTSIGEFAFNRCTGLQSINIPDGVMSIGMRTFDGCASLQSIVLGNGLTKIEVDAFDGCENLRNVYYHGSVEEWDAINIDSGNIKLTSATRYYYSSSDPKLGAGYNSDLNYWHYDENGEIVVWEK